MNKPLSVLVIDDCLDDRVLCHRALNKALNGCVSIIEAGSGEQGLQDLENHIGIDCILLDYSLPGCNGLEILKKIRSSYLYMPIIILTGQGNETVAVQAIKERAQDYITKSSINSDTLYRIIKMAIEHCQMEKCIEEQQAALSLYKGSCP